MPIIIVCGECDKRLKVDDKFVGKRVRCPNCQAIISVPAEDEPPDEDERDDREDGIAERPGRSAVGRPDEEDEEAEDRPRRRRQEEEERPSRASRRRDDDEEEDDRPRRPRRRAGGGESGQGMAITSMILGIAGIVVCLVGCCCILGSIGGPIVGGVAVILGFVARGQGSRSGMAVSGIITGFAAIALGILLLILTLVGAFANAALGPGGAGPNPPGGRPGMQRGF